MNCHTGEDPLTDVIGNVSKANLVIQTCWLNEMKADHGVKTMSKSALRLGSTTLFWQITLSFFLGVIYFFFWSRSVGFLSCRA